MTDRIDSSEIYKKVDQINEYLTTVQCNEAFTVLAIVVAEGMMNTMPAEEYGTAIQKLADYISKTITDRQAAAMAGERGSEQ